MGKKELFTIIGFSYHAVFCSEGCLLSLGTLKVFDILLRHFLCLICNKLGFYDKNLVLLVPVDNNCLYYFPFLHHFSCPLFDA